VGHGIATRKEHKDAGGKGEISSWRQGAHKEWHKSFRVIKFIEEVAALRNVTAQTVADTISSITGKQDTTRIMAYNWIGEKGEARLVELRASVGGRHGAGEGQGQATAEGQLQEEGQQHQHRGEEEEGGDGDPYEALAVLEIGRAHV
jgi:hypothetical protein